MAPRGHFRAFGHGLGIEYAARSMLAFEFYGQAFARWLQEQNKGRPIRWEKVEPGDVQILPIKSCASWTQSRRIWRSATTERRKRRPVRAL